MEKSSVRTGVSARNSPVLFLSHPSTAPSVSVVSPNTDEFLDLLASSQSRRLDDQRASFSNLPGLRLTKANNQSVLERLMTNDKKEPDEDFFDILVKCQVSVHTRPSVDELRLLWQCSNPCEGLDH